MKVVNFLKVSESRLEMTEKLEHIFKYSEINIKYFSFLTSSFLDLLCTLKGLFNSESEWEDIYYSKSGFLTIYETINTYHFHQKEIKKIVDNDHPNLLDDYKKLNSFLKEYKSKYNHKTEIGPIRNKTAGHFDKNFTEYYELVKKLNKTDSIKAIESFLNFLKLLMYFINTMADLMKVRTEIDLDKSKREFYKNQNNG
ncbi:hypothetical protein I602_1976 [Polaribacter dokdonensis DSW-5]|nr:hypothetical protein I602_1976 [Polaribacter dokdonensis DSW-5]